MNRIPFGKGERFVGILVIHVHMLSSGIDTGYIVFETPTKAWLFDKMKL
jgi:hypothetical protein